MQNKWYNTLTQREKYPPLSDCNSVSYTTSLQCITSPAAHGQPRAGGAFLFSKNQVMEKDCLVEKSAINNQYVR